jgi:hypothetical protein
MTAPKEHRCMRMFLTDVLTMRYEIKNKDKKSVVSSNIVTDTNAHTTISQSGVVYETPDLEPIRKNRNYNA